MRIRAALLALTLLPCATAHAAADPPVPETALRDAATRGMALVDRSLAVWQQQRTCFSCHHQALPIAATDARTHPRAFPSTKRSRGRTSARGSCALKSLDRNVQGYQQIDLSMEVGTELATGAIAGVPPGIARAAAARAVAGWQLPDGHWTTLDVRPPQSFGVIPATAMSIRGVQAYWPAGHDAELVRAHGTCARLAPERPRRATRRTWSFGCADCAGPARPPPTSLRRPRPCGRHSAPTAAGASCPREARMPSPPAT